jgi:hypothetical protein
MTNLSNDLKVDLFWRLSAIMQAAKDNDTPDLFNTAIAMIAELQPIDDQLLFNAQIDYGESLTSQVYELERLSWGIKPITFILDEHFIKQTQKAANKVRAGKGGRGKGEKQKQSLKHFFELVRSIEGYAELYKNNQAELIKEIKSKSRKSSTRLVNKYASKSESTLRRWLKTMDVS